MDTQPYRPTYTNDEIESLIRTKIRRAGQTKSSTLEKRANRNVEKFIVDLMDESNSSEEVISKEVLYLTRDHPDGSTPTDGPVRTSVIMHIEIAINPGTTKDRRAASLQFLVDFALILVQGVREASGAKKLDELVEKLRQEGYPA